MLHVKDLTLLGLSRSAVERLESVDLSWCWLVTDMGMKWLSKCGKLKVLKINGCRYVSDTGLKYISEGLHNLQHLNLEECSTITDIGLENIIHSISTLTHLNLLGCTRITDTSIVLMSEKWGTQLNYLELKNCGQVSDRGIEAWSREAERMRGAEEESEEEEEEEKGVRVVAGGVNAVDKFHLEYLGLANCSRVTVGAVERLKRAASALSIILTPQLKLKSLATMPTPSMPPSGVGPAHHH